MITAAFRRNPGGISGFDISGHASDGNFGQSVICAAVSSCAYMAANTVTDVLSVPADIEATGDTPGSVSRFHLRVPDSYQRKAGPVLKGFYIHMKALEEQYRDDIKVITIMEA